MKPEFLLAKLDRMPMLKAVVPFAAGILAADRFALPLWFLAGTFLLSGVSTGAAMLPPKRPSRRGATRPTARGTPQATG